MNIEIKRNYTPIPNQLFDTILRRLNSIDITLLLIIIRLTIGWQKKNDDISYSQFMEFSGINSQTTIANSLKRLEEQKLILIARKPKHTSNYELGEALMLHLNSIDEDIGTTNRDVQNMENSNKWTRSSPENGQESNKTSPNNGETKDNMHLKTTTPRGKDINAYFKNHNIDIPLTVSFCNELAAFLNTNELDLFYIKWLYDQINTKSDIKSIGAYFRTIYSMQAYIDEYKDTQNKAKEQSPEVICPVCEKLSTSSVTCTYCGVHLFDISEATIRREKAFQRLSDEDKRRYTDAYFSATKRMPFGPKLTQILNELKSSFGLPLD